MHRRMGADHTAMLTEMNTVVALIGVSDLRGALDLLGGATRPRPWSCGASCTRRCRRACQGEYADAS